MTSKNPLDFWTFDLETDPFKTERLPQPFCVGAYENLTGNYYEFWGSAEDCIDFMLNIFYENSGKKFFAHNGGKFDFHYFKDFLDFEDLKIIGARIAQCHVMGAELRDSYAMIPVPLAAYKKVEISYDKMEAEVREQHKEEILEYLKVDCIALAELIAGFIEEFGLKLTMAGAAMDQLQKFHEFERIPGPGIDGLFRNFYYGGRVQCFNSGVLKGDWKIYDVNSMYPHVMRDFEHPVSAEFHRYTDKHAATLGPDCDFSVIDATSFGALPAINEKGALYFPHGRHRFHATGHEIRAGLETGTLKVHRYIQSYRATERITFAEFITHFYEARLEAKRKGHKLHDIFYKLVMNSSYGKFAQNPADFKDWTITDDHFPEDSGWLLEAHFPSGLMIWSRPTTKPQHFMRYNIMTAASITGAARAQLLRGLQQAENAVYCDTDSIICEGLNCDLSESKLGGWKLEATGDQIAIAGKKLYALTEKGALVKKASKGVNLPFAEIIDVARGEVRQYANEAPTFSLTKKTRFISRRIRATA